MSLSNALLSLAILLSAMGGVAVLIIICEALLRRWAQRQQWRDRYPWED